MSRFVHAYNFVSTPRTGLGAAGGVSPFARADPATHDRLDPSRFTGLLDCTLRTEGWWFIPDSRKFTEADNGHKMCGYFTLDDVKHWSKDRPEVDETAPAIPASSLRGMVRSVFETATLSCWSVFDDSALDFRVARGLAQDEPEKGSGRGAPELVPARVARRQEDGAAELHVLDGAARDQEHIFPYAIVEAYKPRVGSLGQVGQETELLARSVSLLDGARVAIVIDVTEPSRGPCRIVRDMVQAEAFDTLKPQQDEFIAFGYLHRTGPNFHSKRFERVFFDWPRDQLGEPIENPSTNDASTLRARYEAFLESEQAHSLMIADRSTVHAYESTLKGYFDRTRGELDTLPDVPRRLRPGAPFPSDFVRPGGEGLEVGSLVYVLLEEVRNDFPVRGLYPVSIPRMTHENSRGELLHPDFHTCQKSVADSGANSVEPKHAPPLCPGCRVFGWVRDDRGTGERRPGRVDSVAGHVRFTHGSLVGPWPPNANQRARSVPLAILGAPKPTTTLFYLEPALGFEAASRLRWPPVLARESSIPFYRTAEATLRGRKYYRRRDEVRVDSDNPRTGGVRRRGGTPDRQNRTIHALPEGLQFRFRVYFDNLTEDELGALAFSLTLDLPDEVGPPSNRRHAVGYGKPLGLGACRISIERVVLDEFDDTGASVTYARVPEFFPEDASQSPEPESDRARQALKRSVTAFVGAWRVIGGDPDLKTVWAQLLNLLTVQSPGTPIGYPAGLTNPDKSHEWFQANKRLRKHRLPDPVRETDESSARLPERVD